MSEAATAFQLDLTTSSAGHPFPGNALILSLFLAYLVSIADFMLHAMLLTSFSSVEHSIDSVQNDGAAGLRSV